ncbi:MAG: putative quinol monooxygenase [Blastocatellales bacterium]
MVNIKPGFVVTVEFDLVPEHKDAFREAIIKNADSSFEIEPGCHRFDVSFSEDGTKCFLYELYTDRAAFDFHRTTHHFLEFDRVSPPMIAGKKLQTFHLVRTS